MPDNNVRIKLSADTTQAQKDIKLIDQQIKDLGKGAGGKKGSKSEDSASSKGTSVGDLATLVDINKQILKVLNNMYRLDNNPNANRNIKYLANKIDSLKGTPGTSQGKSSSGSTPTSSTNNNTSPTSGGGSSGGGSSGGGLDGFKKLAGKLVTLTSVLATVKGMSNWIGAGAEKSASLESKAYMTYNSTRMFGNKFNSARDYAYGIGNAYGYGSEATMNFQNDYMGAAGFTSKDALTSDTSSLMRVSKAYGIDLSGVGSVAGKQVQTGTFMSGEQSKFANLLATSINEAGMTGRESEQLSVLESINDTLAQTLVTVTEDGQNSATALYNLLATTEDSLKGARGANAISSINSAITGGGNKMDVLLGWGTSYTGAAGRWELEKRKAEGISNPDNLSDIFSNYERITGMSIGSAYGKLDLQGLLGIDPELVEILVQNAESIKSRNYSESFLSALKSYKGDTDVSGLISNWSGSKVSTQERYTNATENAQAAMGDLKNSLLSPLKNFYLGLSPGAQAGVSLGGVAAGGLAAGAIGKWSANKGVDLFGKLFKGGDGTPTSVSDRVVGASDDIADGLDDIARAAGRSADDVAKAASKFGKAGKIAGVIGIGIEALTTTIDTKNALDRGDERAASSEIGEGVGAIGGGLAGAKAGAAIGTLINPGLGTAIGGIIGGIAGGLAGGWAGSSAGGGIYDLVSDKEDLSEGQKTQLRAHYDMVSKLYKSKGNNAAQAYTLQMVVPFLNSIGVSTSITDKYKSDVGKPDFLKDYEDGKFKLGIDYVPRDRFIAELHQGEAVLTEGEAKKWRQRNSLDNINKSINIPQSSGTAYNGTSLLEIRLSGAVDGITQENQHILVQAIIQQLGLSKNSVLGNLGNSFVRVPN